MYVFDEIIIIIVYVLLKRTIEMNEQYTPAYENNPVYVHVDTQLLLA